MKLTVKQLKRLIKEEANKILKENLYDDPSQNYMARELGRIKNQHDEATRIQRQKLLDHLMDRQESSIVPDSLRRELYDFCDALASADGLNLHYIRPSEE